MNPSIATLGNYGALIVAFWLLMVMGATVICLMLRGVGLLVPSARRTFLILSSILAISVTVFSIDFLATSTGWDSPAQREQFPMTIAVLSICSVACLAATVPSLIRAFHRGFPVSPPDHRAEPPS